MLVAVVFCATTLRTCAQDKVPVHTHRFNDVGPACQAEKKWTTSVDYEKMEKELFTLDDGKAVKAREDWRLKRVQIEKRILSVFGPFPKQVPLEPQVLQEDKYHGLLRRKVSYQVEDGERVSAWLLIPEGCPLTKRNPAILCIHQTLDVGKDEPIGLRGMPHLNFALKLSKEHGYITLIPDLLTAGERVTEGMKPFFTDEFYKRRPEWSMFGKNLWDSMKAIDYLQSLEFVDLERIGCTGHSLGGGATLILAAFDDRVKVAVESCGGLQPFQANWEHALKFSRTQWYIYSTRLRPYFLKKTTPFDIHELMALIAPRPYLQTGAFNDGINPNPLDKVLAAKLVRKVYKFLRIENNLNLFMHHGTHGYPPIALKYGVELFDNVLLDK